MKRAGIASEVNSWRGFDHSLFIPLKITHHETDISCIQLSLFDSLIPENHLRLGEVLQGLEQDNLLLIGSGFSFHNLLAFFKSDDTSTRATDHTFEDWLTKTYSDPGLSKPKWRPRLLNLDNAPHARLLSPKAWTPYSASCLSWTCPTVMFRFLFAKEWELKPLPEHHLELKLKPSNSNNL